MSATKEHHHDAIEAGQRGTKQHPIGWLNMPGYKPETWNPIVGCSKVSPGCDNCFAEKQAFIRSFNSNTPQYKNVIVNHPLDPRYREWNGKTHLVKSALDKPAKWKKPRMIFTVDMGDLFHESTPFEWIDAVFSVMSDNDQHIYVLLTKRPGKMLKFWQWKREQHSVDWRPKDNVWIGVTAENQEQANKRIPVLLQIPAAKRFVSIEPMLGPVDLKSLKFGMHKIDCIGGLTSSWNTEFKTNFSTDNFGKLDWVICGGETGPKARPMHPDWVRSLRDQCKAAGTPFFFKQWGEWGPMMGYKNASEPIAEHICHLGRKAAGNILDGQQHHEWPKINR